MATSLGNTTKAFVSAITTMDKRAFFDKVVDIQGEDRFTRIMQSGGLMQETTNMHKYGHWVNSALQIVADTTDSTVTNSGTPTVTITGITAATSGFAKEGMIVKLKGNKNARIYSVTLVSTQDTLVIKSVDNTNLTVVAGDPIAFSSFAAVEGGNAPVNSRRDNTYYENFIQTFKNTNTVTDMQQVTEVEASFGGKHYFYVQELAEKYLELRKMVAGAMWGGQKSASDLSSPAAINLDANSKGWQTTMGIDQYTTTYGSSYSCATPGTIITSDWASMHDALLAKKSVKNHMLYLGTSAYRAVSNWAKNLGSSGLTSARLEVNGQTLNLDMEMFTYGGFKHKLIQLDMFDDPTQYMFTNASNIGKSIYFIPEGNTPVVTETGASAGTQPRLSIKYLKQPPSTGGNSTGNDIFAEYHTGQKAPGGPTSQTAVWNTDWETKQGLQYLGAQHGGKMFVG